MAQNDATITINLPKDRGIGSQPKVKAISIWDLQSDSNVTIPLTDWEQFREAVDAVDQIIQANQRRAERG